ncbi:MAG: saccharopine dehydrogenase C-terminal domain-containing protein [Pseudomonadota bacterium]
MQHARLARLDGRLLMLGFGSIGQGVLPLLLRHLEIDPGRITILTRGRGGRAQAVAQGVAFHAETVTADNLEDLFARHLKAGDFLLNLSYGVSSLAALDWCQRHAVGYLDACIEPWAGAHETPAIPPERRSNYAYREAALALRRQTGQAPTAVINHGVNPGLVSHFVKRALRQLAQDAGLGEVEPSGQAGWASLARDLGVRAIHIAERDTQVTFRPKRPGEFVNTWSAEAFIGEACQPAELGWGTHERHFPPDGVRHATGAGAAIWLRRPGAATRVRSWTPLAGPYHGFLITHAESVSIADFLTLREGSEVVYRPTVHYAYHPCDDAVLSLHELAGRNWQPQTSNRLLMDDLVEGVDELGVLLLGHVRTAYWYGSRLSLEQARALAPCNNATTLQTAAGVLAGVVWALNHPGRGIVEPDELDHEAVLAAAEPYLGEMVGVYGDWTPLSGRGRLFPEEMDGEDPWQFVNARVT